MGRVTTSLSVTGEDAPGHEGEWQAPAPVARVAPPTFDASSAQWLRERDLEPRILEGDEHLLRRYLAPVLRSLTIHSVTPSVVRTRWSQLLRDLPTVRARSSALLKAILNTAVADGVVDSNPCRIRGAANTPRAREIRPASLEERSVIVEAIASRHRALAPGWRPVRCGTPTSAAGSRVVTMPPHTVPAVPVAEGLPMVCTVLP